MSASKRRSWYTPGRSGLRASLACSTNQTLSPPSPPISMPTVRLDNPKDVNETDEVMILTHFSKPPHIDFGKIRTGRQVSRTLTIRNPHDYAQDVTIEKFPFKKYFSINHSTFSVNEESEAELTLTWCPQEEICCREMILLKVNGVYRLQAYVLGRCEEPKKPKKKKPIFKGKSTMKQTMRGREPFKSLNPATTNSIVPTKKQPLASLSPNILIQQREPLSEKCLPSYDCENEEPYQEALKVRKILSPKLNALEISILDNSPGGAEKNNRMESICNSDPRRATFAVKSSGNLEDDADDDLAETHDLRRETVVVSNLKEFDNSKEFDDDKNEYDIRRETVLVRKRNLENDLEDEPASNVDIRRETVVKSFEEIIEDADDDCDEVTTANVDIRRETVVVKRSSKITSYKAQELPDIMSLAVDDSPCFETVKLTRDEIPTELNKTPSPGIDLRRATYVPRQPMRLDAQERNSYSDAVGETVSMNFQPVMGENSRKNLQSPNRYPSLQEPDTPPFDSLEPYGINQMNTTPTNIQWGPVTSYSATYASTPTSQQAPEFTSFAGCTPASLRRSRTYTKILERTPLVKSETYDLKDRASPRSSISRDSIESAKSSGSEQFEDSLMILDQSRFESDPVKNSPVTPNSFLRESLSKPPPQSDEVFSPEHIFKNSLPHFAVIEKLKTDREYLKSPPVFNLLPHQQSPSPTSTERLTPINSATVTKAKSCLNLNVSTEEALFVSSSKFRNTSLALPDTPSSEIRRLTVVKDTPSEVLEKKKGKKLFEEAATTPKLLNSNIIQRRSIFRCQQRCDSPNQEGPDVNDEKAHCTVVVTGKATTQRLEEAAIKRKEIVTKRQIDIAKQEQINHRQEKAINENRDQTFNQNQEETNQKLPMQAPLRARPVISQKVDILNNKNRSRSVGTRPLTSSNQSTLEKSRARHESERVVSLKRRSDEFKSSLQKRVKSDTQFDKRLTRTEKLRIEVSTGKKHSPMKKDKLRRPSGNKPLAQARLVLKRSTGSPTALPKHPMPFASHNMYYDEKWMEKEERGFTRWLNFILTPPDEDQDPHAASQEAVSLCLSPRKPGSQADKLAPSKEQLSLRTYTARRKLNKLRRQSCKLFQSEQVIHVVRRIEKEIDCQRLVVRCDRVIHADLGISQRVLDIILMYNPLWLRIGLETTYGEILPVHGSSDVNGLSRFVLTRFLHNPDLAKEFAHPTVPHFYKPGYDRALSAFTLKRFLLLVYFLDCAKQNRLIQHDPCLFKKDAQFKSSRELLVEFNKNYLRGEGDLCKHLSYLGYHVNHHQTALDEYDYAVTNLSSALRDGLRLVRAVQILTNEWTLNGKLRVPAISRLQKIHNVDLAFAAIIRQGIQLETLQGHAITSRDLVDGHREKTLAILWRILFKFQIEILIDVKQLEDEIGFLSKLHRHQNDMASMYSSTSSLCSLGLPRDTVDHTEYYKSEKLALLLKWCQAVCAFYAVKVENFTTSFSDGRVLCYILHHYQPALLPRAMIHDVTTLTVSSANQSGGDPDESADDSLDPVFGDGFSPVTGKPSMYYRLLDNEKENFKVVLQKVSDLGGVPVMIRASDMSNTIPDEKLVIAFTLYVCARLLDIRAETRAARVIQSAWRQHRLRKAHRNYEECNKAAITIQRAVRNWLNRHRDVMRHVACVTIQSAWRMHLARRDVMNKLRVRQIERQRAAVVLIQTSVRGYLCRRQYARHLAAKQIQSSWRRHYQRQRYLSLRRDVITLQSLVRMRRERNHFLRMRQSVICMQQTWRRVISSRKERANFLLKRSRIVFLQRQWRCLKTLKEKQRTHAVVKIQTMVRGFLQRRKFIRVRSACICLQTRWKMIREIRRFAKLKHSVLYCQQRFREVRLSRDIQREFIKIKLASIKIQSFYKGYVERKNYLKLKKAAVLVQKCLRARIQSRNYEELRRSTVVFQQRWRALLLRNRVRKEFLQKRNAAVKIQSCFRGFHTRRDIHHKLEAVVTIQSLVRMFLERKRYSNLKNAVLLIQRKWRAEELSRSHMMGYAIMKGNAIVIQSSIRGWLVRRHLALQKSAALTIQSAFRMYSARREFLKTRNSARVIQNWYRGIQLCREAKIQCRDRLASIVKIQSIIRRWQVQKRIRLQTMAVVKIQKCARGYIARRDYLRKLEAVSRIQIAYRSWKKMKIARQEFTTVKRGITLLQAQVRRRIAQSNYHHLRRKVIVIQSFWRCYYLRKEFMQRRQAALILQKRYRKVIKTRRQRSEFLKLRIATIRIQSLFRGFLAWREFESKRNAVVRIQAWTRMMVERRKFIRKRQAILRIQYVTRQWLVRNRQEKHRTLLEDSACRIQAVIRGFLARKDLEKRQQSACCIQKYVRCYLDMSKYQRLRKSALAIQKFYRHRQVMKQCREDYVRKRILITRIQSRIRGYLVRKDMKLRVSAATILQARYRMYLLRRRFLRLKNCAIFVQRRFRAILKMKDDYLQYHWQRGAAIVIQSNFRTVLARRNYLRMRSATILLQTQFRAKTARRKFLMLKSSAVTIQRAYRTQRSILKAKVEFVDKIQNIVKIQTWYRAVTQRKEYKHLRKIVILLQSRIRGMRSKRAFIKTRSSAQILQAHFRAHLAMKRQREQYEHDRKSIVLAQTAVRRFLAQKRFEKERAVVKLQSVWRMYRERRQFLKLKQACVVVQAVFRGQCRRREFLRIKTATICIQSHYRAYQLGQTIRYQLLRWNCAAMAIQTWFRTFKIRREFLEERRSVVRIQACVRRYLAQKCLATTKTSALLIQKWFRSVLETRRERDRYLTLKSSAVKIQAMLRGYLVRKDLKLTLSVVLIQSFVRMHLQRSKFTKQKRLICKIQAIVRGNQERKRLLRKRTAVRSIENWYFELVKRRKILKNEKFEHDSATKLQAFYRGFAQRKRYETMKIRLVRLQALCQGFLARKSVREVDRRRYAAKVIQKCYREYKEKLVMQEHDRQRSLYLHRFTNIARYHYSAIQIQRTYRNHRALQQALRHLRSVHTIQRWMRSHLQRMRYVKMRQSAITIQRNVRQWLQRRHRAAIIIQSAARKWLEQRQTENRKSAALRIQALWRGYCVRRRLKNKKIAEVRRRLQFANEAATEDKLLGNRTTFALEYLLQYRQLSAILEALMHLDAATRLSWRCCERMVESGAVDILFTLMRSCNRSIPHMEIIKLSLSVLINLSRYDRTVGAIFLVEGSLASLIELLSIYLGKGLVFTRTCTLLGILASQNKDLSNYLNDKLAQKLRSIHSITVRKHKLSEQYKQNLARKSAFKKGDIVDQTPSKRFIQQPFWLLRKGSVNNEPDEPIEAIEFVMTSFRLGFLKK